MTQRERIEALEAAVTALKHQNCLQEQFNTHLTNLVCSLSSGGRVQLELVNNIAEIVLQAGKAAQGPVVANDQQSTH